MRSEQEISGESSRTRKARAVVEDEGVKLHKFHPSGKIIWTVAGRECDFLVDFLPEDPAKIYCACGDFYYRVLSTKIPECYHLLACKIAFREQLYIVLDHDDEELPDFLKKLVADNFRSINSSPKAGKAEREP